MSVRKAVGRGAAFVLLGAMLTGCAFYSPTRDEQGKAAKDAWEKATTELDASIATAKQNQKSFLDARLKQEDALWEQRGKSLTFSILGKNYAQFELQVDKSAVWLLGPPAMDLKTVPQPTTRLQELADARAALITAQRDYQLIAQSVEASGRELPSCSVLLIANDENAAERDQAKRQVDAFLDASSKGDAIVRGRLDSDTKKLLVPCRKLAAGLGVYGGSLGDAQVELAKDLKELEARKAEVAEAEAAYQVADAEAKKAQAEFTAQMGTDEDKIKSRTKLIAALTKAEKALDALKKSSNPYAIRLVANARVASVDHFISTFSDVKAGKGSPEDASKAAIALAVFIDLREKADVVLKAQGQPDLVPLTIQKSIDEARVARAQREIDFAESRISFRKAKIDVLVNLAWAYRSASTAMQNQGVIHVYKATGVTLFTALQPLAEQDLKNRGSTIASENTSLRIEGKSVLWEAVPIYLDAERKLRAEAAKIDHQIVSLSFLQAASYEEMAFSQWKVLVSSTVGALNDYGASGTKATDVSKFLDTVALFVIGWRIK